MSFVLPPLIPYLRNIDFGKDKFKPRSLNPDLENPMLNEWDIQFEAFDSRSFTYVKAKHPKPDQPQEICVIYSARAFSIAWEITIGPEEIQCTILEFGIGADSREVILNRSDIIGLLDLVDPRNGDK